MFIHSVLGMGMKLVGHGRVGIAVQKASYIISCRTGAPGSPRPAAQALCVTITAASITLFPS